MQAVYYDASPSGVISITRTVPSVGQLSLTSTSIYPFIGSPVPTHWLSQDPSNIIIGQRVQISLSDLDLPDTSRPVVSLQSSRLAASADSETVTLTTSKPAAVMLESYQNWGQFTGVIDSVPSHTYIAGNGVLELDRTDELEASYTDAYPPSTVTSIISIGGISDWPQFRGRLSLSPSPLLQPDQELTVTVVDYDLDTDGTGNGETQSDWSHDASTVVAVRSLLTYRNASQEILVPTGHEELLALVESADAGTFTGVLQTQTRDCLRASGVLCQAQAGGKVQVEYLDRSAGLSVTAQLSVASTARLQFSPQVSRTSAGAPAIITLVDLDGETGLDYVRNASVNVSLLGSTSAPVAISLIETGHSSRVYTGAVATSPLSQMPSHRFRPRCPQTSLAVTGASLGDRIQADYFDTSAPPREMRATDTARVVSSTMLLGSQTGSIEMSTSSTGSDAPLRIGDVVSITVRDQDLNKDSSIPERELRGLVVVYGHAWACDAASYPSCQTSQLADGSYSFHSCQGFLPHNHSCLNAQPKPGGLCPGEDPDIAAVSCPKTDWEEVTLSETGCNTGVFTGTMGTTQELAAREPANNQLFLATQAKYSTQLRAVYMDKHPAGNMNEAYLGVETQGELVAQGQDRDTSAFSIGEMLAVTVTDFDANLDWCSIDSVSVNLTATRGGGAVLVDKETLSLTETAVASGVFTGQLPTAGVQPSSAAAITFDSFLTLLTSGDHVVVEYADRSCATLVQHHCVASHGGDLSATVGVVLAGGSLHVTVMDADLNTDPVNLGETVVGRLRVSTNKDSQTEDLVLSESVVANTFVGILNTDRELNRGRSNSGELNVMEGDLLTVTYQDAAPAASRTAVVRVAAAATVLTSPSLPAVGHVLSVTINDFDLNLDPRKVETGLVNAYLQPSSPLTSAGYRVSNSGNVQRPATFGQVTVTETATSSSVFTGRLLMSARASAVAPQIASEAATDHTGEIVACRGGDTLTVTYTDQFPYQDARATVSIYAKAQLSVSSPWINAGETLTITIADSDMNQDAYAAESIDKTSSMLWIETSKPTPGDREFLQATETGVDSVLTTLLSPASACVLVFGVLCLPVLLV